MQIKPGKIAVYMGDFEDLNVVIGVDGRWVRFYEVRTGRIMTVTSEFIQFHFKSL
tara:strand:- start:364 stop:528 length:165 start_codon:yes stop_codon:yes gene_type:complete